MIVSVHIVDLSRAETVGFARRRVSPDDHAGLRWGAAMICAPISGRLPPPAPSLRRASFVAFWDDDESLDRFLDHDPLGGRLRDGWSTRLVPTRLSGDWPGLSRSEMEAASEGPAAVLTLGALRLRNAGRFVRANAPAADEAVRHPGLLATTGMARPPRTVCTFSLWRDTDALKDYAYGASGPGHVAAVRAQSDKPFHHQSAFVRFRPYAADGHWDGTNPLEGLVGTDS